MHPDDDATPVSDAGGRRASRRRLILGAAALGAAHVVAGCARRTDSLGVGTPTTAAPTTSTTARPTTTTTTPPTTTTTTTTPPAPTTTTTLVPPPPPPPAEPVPAPPGSVWTPGWFVNRVDSGDLRLALTFDDGPSPENTPEILDHLRAAGVRATFFVVGVNVRAFPDLTRRIVDEGHELGNHSVYHEPYEPGPLALQLRVNQELIRHYIGVTPVVHRAPGLVRGNEILAAGATYGVYEAHTAMTSTDWTLPRRDADELLEDFIGDVRSGTFAIFHDGGRRRPTTDAVPAIIEHAQTSGYALTTVTEMVNGGAPRPGNQSYPPLAGLVAPRWNDRYDAKRGLEEILTGGRVRLSRTTRSRIVEALADIDVMRRQR